MDFVRTRATLFSVLVAVGLIAGLAANLLHTQEQGRKSLRDALDRRAELTGRLIGSAFMASNTPERARQQYGGSPRAVVRTVAVEDRDHPMYVLDAKGGVMASTHPSIARDRDRIERSHHLRVALAGVPALSDAFRDERGRWLIEIAVPFEARSGGRRVLVVSGPVEIVRNFADGFFASASATPGSDGYLLDGTGRKLSEMPAAGTAEKAALTLTREELRRSSGVRGKRTFVTASVPSSRWRVVLSVPTARLYDSVDGGTSRAAWVLFAAFSFAICGLLAFGFSAARGARRLAAANERENAARELAHERLHDPLTGLPNRTLFQDRGHQALAAARRDPRSVAVIFMDIDRFKRINDSLGHDAGDVVLREVAQRLAASVRPEDTVSRFGGDEFVILCEGLDGDDVLHMVGRVTQSLQAPIAIGGRQMQVTLSVGVAMHAPGDVPSSAGDLVRDADIAMYRAKGRGGARVELFDAELHQRAVERLDQEVALRRAIDEEHLVVHYQPIVALPAGRVHGAEALVRWRRPETGELAPPGDFIALAEETGMIAELGAWVLRTAIREVGDWARDGLVDEDFELSVNLSAIQLSDPRLPDHVAEALRGWDLEPSRLCLELTETAVMSEAAAAETMLERLHGLGVRLALDDFGIGHSSLGQLARSMPISTLKLDRSFVAAISEPRDRGILQAAASMAFALQLSSVAEGVETPEQAAELAEMGFPYGQGYHFGRPTDGPAFVERLGKPAHAEQDSTAQSPAIAQAAAGTAGTIDR